MDPMFKEKAARHLMDLIFQNFPLFMSFKVLLHTIECLKSPLKDLDDFAETLHALVVAVERAKDLANGSKQVYISNTCVGTNSFLKNVI